MSYGVYSVRILEKIDCVITALHCMSTVLTAYCSLHTFHLWMTVIQDLVLERSIIQSCENPLHYSQLKLHTFTLTGHCHYCFDPMLCPFSKWQSNVWVVGLTHLLLDEMAAISQPTFSFAVLWMKSFVFWFKFHWSLFLRVQLTIIQQWFR